MNQNEFLSMFEAIKKACVMAIYSGDVSRSPESERDSCASKIRLLAITEVVKSPQNEDSREVWDGQKMEE